MAVTFDGPLVILNLLLIAIFLTLHVIADQRAGSQPESAAYSGSGTWVTNRCTDKSAGCGAAECADTRALFSRCQ